MGRGRTFGRALALIALLATAIAGCGDDGDQRAAPRGPTAMAIRDLQEAFASGNTAAICAQMTAPARRQAHAMGKGGAGGCARAVQSDLGVLAAGGLDPDEPPAIIRTQLDGSPTRATVRVGDESGQQADVALIREDGAWKLAGFFGVPPMEFALLEESFRIRQPPRYDAPPVAGLDGDGQPCPRMRDRQHPAITGGCRFTVAGERIPVRVLSPFGGFELAECEVSYRVYVAPQGHTWTAEVTFGDDAAPGCGEIEPCRTEEGLFRPWSGRFVKEDDDSFLHYMDICLRTGVGLFGGGNLVIRMARQGDGWRAEPSDHGATGFRIDGELEVSGEPFDLR